jgi:hypothetical protein
MHKIHRNIAVAIGGLVLALVFLAPPSAQGDDWDLKTIFSVNVPFQVPGHTLEANKKYVLQLLDLSSNRHVVQIFTENKEDLITTFMAASAQRLEPADDPTFEFIETDPGYPKPVKTYFYPGRLNGLEFIYSKDQAMEIVRHTRQGVLTAEGEVDFHDLNTVEIAALHPDDVVIDTIQTAQTEAPAEIQTDMDAETVTDAELDTDRDVAREQEQAQVDTESTDVESTVSESTEPAVQDTDMDAEPAIDETTEESLPATAGGAPLIGLIGLLSLGAGFGLRAFRS